MKFYDKKSFKPKIEIFTEKYTFDQIYYYKFLPHKNPQVVLPRLPSVFFALRIFFKFTF